MEFLHRLIDFLNACIKSKSFKYKSELRYIHFGARTHNAQVEDGLLLCILFGCHFVDLGVEARSLSEQ